MYIVYNRPVAQIPQCTSSISHNPPLCNKNVHIFLLQNGALGDIWLMHCEMHCEICEMDLFHSQVHLIPYKFIYN